MTLVSALAALPPWSQLTLPGFVALLLIALTAGLARGLTGFGSGLIFIPLASIFVGPKQAAALLLLTDLIGALPTVPAAWREADRRPVFLMIAGALVGIPLGMVALLVLDPVAVRWSISILVLGLLGLLISGWRWSGAAPAAAITGTGVLSGVLSGLAQIGGPPVVAFWLGLPQPLAVIRANIMLFFAMSSAVSLVVYAAGGLLGWGTVALALCTLPSYTGGVLLGMRLFRFTDPALFRKLVLALIGLAALLGMPIWGGPR